jgi:hypothetical protein
MTRRYTALCACWLLTLAFLTVQVGCSHEKGDGNSSASAAAKAEPDVVVGKVAKDPASGALRFSPDNCPDHHLRLTGLQMQAAMTPQSQEIPLDAYAGKKIRVKYQRVDPTWVWGAEVLGPVEK